MSSNASSSNASNASFAGFSPSPRGTPQVFPPPPSSPSGFADAPMASSLFSSSVSFSPRGFVSNDAASHHSSSLPASASSGSHRGSPLAAPLSVGSSSSYQNSSSVVSPSPRDRSPSAPLSAAPARSSSGSSSVAGSVDFISSTARERTLSGSARSQREAAKLDNLPATASAIMKTLKTRPVLRGVDLRIQAGRLRNPRYDGRNANWEAGLAQRCGQVASSPCSSCAGGYGCFTECVVLSGFFRGACANCHHGSTAVRCSFYNGK